jgi:hypothetical protein
LALPVFAPGALKFNLIIVIILKMEERVLLADNGFFPFSYLHVTGRVGADLDKLDRP